MSQLQLKKLHFEPFKLQSGYIVEMLQQQLVDGSTNSRKRERGKTSHIVAGCQPQLECSELIYFHLQVHHCIILPGCDLTNYKWTSLSQQMRIRNKKL